MSVPNKIKISREEDYYTHYIGKYSNGKQFMALISATLPSPPPEDLPNHKKYYAILHTFDPKGKHLDTQTVFVGRAADGEDQIIEKARLERNKMLSSLGEVLLEDVEVELFSVNIDGFIFGLVDATDPEQGIDRIDLLPNDFAFFEPWDGTYDT